MEVFRKLARKVGKEVEHRGSQQHWCHYG